MSKQIQRNEDIYLAIEMLGKYQDENPVVFDERSGETLDPKNLDNKIKIYEREVKEWFLDIASRLAEYDEFKNGFVILMICMSYFEGVEQYKTGVASSSRSKECFKDSIKRLYPEKFKDKELENLYSKSRCGLFHNGMVKGGVVFSYSFDEPIEFLNARDIIKINPKRLIDDIKDDFDRYLNDLKDVTNRTSRENFDRLFNVLDN
ncbi:hypothetical protein APA_2789 [Pseudanabaena sp. lw0831]|uniref:hypothetical protein n=1 Tax=Pseudanabaena sp. lw0831 TaxID=1357935 RepID=UPI00191631AC|nr:hypothetical protein [Pseudanabaena sp. lw0831]GBO54738.1 hypothetical protein APA_2789 [Pseudanabaena sp. lw0831]